MKKAFNKQNKKNSKYITIIFFYLEISWDAKNYSSEKLVLKPNSFFDCQNFKLT